MRLLFLQHRFVIYFDFIFDTTKHLMHMVKCRDYSNYDPDIVFKEVGKIDCSPIYDAVDVNTMLLFFNFHLCQVFVAHAPLIKKKVKMCPCKWLNNDIKKRNEQKRNPTLKSKKSHKESD